METQNKETSELDKYHKRQELMSEHVSPVSDLGRNAVRFAFDSDIFTAMHPTGVNLSNYLLDRREIEDHSMSVARYVNRHRRGEGIPFSPMLANAIIDSGSKDANSFDIVDKLYEKNNSSDYVVEDRTYLNFLEWYNYAHIQSQNEAKEQVDKSKVEYIGQVNKAIEDGWIPRPVKKYFKRRLDSLNIVADEEGNNIDNKIYSSGDHNITTLAQYREDERKMLFNATVGVSISNVVDDTFSHEATHSISGSDSQIEDGKYLYGGLRRVFGNTKEGVAVDEAVTEHIRLSLVDGSVDVVSPNEKIGYYSDERLLLDNLCNKGLVKIDIREFIASYFEDSKRNGQYGSNSERKKLAHNLAKAFPGVGATVFDINGESFKFDFSRIERKLEYQ